MNLDNVKHLTIGGKNAVRLAIGDDVLWKGLPEGYVRLDYIESTGDNYIDTGFIPNQDTRVVCEFMLTQIVNLGGIYGARKSVVLNDFSFRTSYSSSVGNRWQPCYNNQYGTFTDVKVDTEWHTVDHNKNEFYFDGELKTQSPMEYAEFTAPRPITIGAVKNNASINYSKARFRHFKIYDDGVLVRDLIPCQDANGNDGMYDTLNAVFYGFISESKMMMPNEIETPEYLV